ncbi:hypothetical protein LCGC14_1197430 [marine sediment metagenome]|uniref:Lambda phage tail tube protein N-terminal domain-containing protein n=1 Tax=marine sediment metagenome TaxID=412755 RepID=A0A0F9PMT3_9ZZZZ
MSDGFVGHGTTLVGSTTGTVGNVISVTVGGRTRDMIDKSTMDSTSMFREFMAGMADEGEFTAEVNFDDGAISVALNTAFQAATSETWTIDFGTKTFAITGVISGLSVNDPFDDKITMSITIKATGIGAWT